MLKPAMLYKDEIEQKFSEELYTERYYYYAGYPHEFSSPNIEPRDYCYQWAIVQRVHPVGDYPEEKLVGYLAYHVDILTNSVDRFGLYSFEPGNQTVIKDTYEKLEELVDTYHRVEWRVVEGNHAKHGYDAFCARHNGKCVCLHDSTKDLQGQYRNQYIYEIVNKEN